jgi:hypothetical protein
MKILENEIATIQPFGILDGKPVKLVTTKGGLNLATSLDSRGQEQVLGAASHQAILCYTIEQRFPNFQPMLMKSEGIKLEAESHSHFLTDSLRKSGHDIYSIQNSNDVEFYLTRQNIRVNSIKGSVQGDTLVVSGPTYGDSNWDSFSKAISEKALSIGLSKVKVK